MYNSGKNRRDYVRYQETRMPYFMITRAYSDLQPTRQFCHGQCLVLLLVAVFVTRFARADGQSMTFHIPPQRLASALNEYADAANVQLSYPAAQTADLKSPGVEGRYTPQQALQKLLAGTPITARQTANGTVTLEQRTAPTKQTAPFGKTPPPQSETTLEKVTVEADAGYDPDWVKDPYNPDYVLPNATSGTKTDTPIMETPLNVQSISKQVLKDQQVINLDQALKNVSGVTLAAGADQGNGDQWFLRGFTTNTLFRNGFRMDNFNGFDNGQQFANVESVEVLKGPAAILYGRVEPGGMVNIITKQPRATPYYSLNQQFGSYSMYRTSIDATGPLTKDDTLLYRMNASFQSNNTFRDLNNNEDVFLAPIVKWNISPRTQATLEMEYQHQNTNFDQQILPFANNHFIKLPPSRNLLERNPLETEQIFVGFNWSHQFNDDWSIKHQVNFKRRDENLGITAFPLGIRLNKREVDRSFYRSNLSTDTVATNLDLTGHFKTWGLEHTLLLGGDYYRFDFSQDSLDAKDQSAINFDQPIHLENRVVFNQSSRFHFKQYADNYGLYLQDQIKLPYHLHVMGGFRYQNVHQATETAGADGKFTIADFRPPRTDEAVTPRVGLVWQPKNWLSIYGNYAESFGATLFGVAFGGIDSAGKPLPAKPLPPTSAQQWEVGTKVEFFDGRLRATLAYYDLTKQNVATTDFTAGHECNGGGALSCSIAVGEVRSRGPELDIQGEILPGWNVIATYANQDVRVNKSNDSQGAAKVGNRLQFVPRNTGSVWTTYEIQQGDLKGFKIGGGVRLQDGVVNAANTFKSPGFALVGLLAGYSFEVGKSKITAQLNVDNLLDKNYITNVAPQPDVNFGYVTFSTPRTFMGSINIQY
jgi:iron complex outermembrane recepter protein